MLCVVDRPVFTWLPEQTPPLPPSNPFPTCSPSAPSRGCPPCIWPSFYQVSKYKYRCFTEFDVAVYLKGMGWDSYHHFGVDWYHNEYMAVWVRDAMHAVLVSQEKLHLQNYYANYSPRSDLPSDSR
jgi:hypothetical protein